MEHLLGVVLLDQVLAAVFPLGSEFLARFSAISRVWVEALEGDTVFVDVWESSELKTSIAAAVDDFVAINQLLLGVRVKLSSLDGMSSLKSASGRE